MEQHNITLSDAERLVLDSYRNLVDGLADYLCDGYEIVLHSLESVEHAVIAIANGHHTGRGEGSPITDLAMQMLQNIKQNGGNGYTSYFTRNPQGEPLHSSTIVIYGEKHRAIGLLCINFYLNTPFSTIASNHTECTAARPMITETFVDNADELLERVVLQLKEEVDADSSILPSNKNKEIIRRCNKHGIFQIKNAVPSVAQLLNISKNTVYLHLKSIEKEN